MSLHFCVPPRSSLTAWMIHPSPWLPLAVLATLARMTAHRHSRRCNALIRVRAQRRYVELVKGEEARLAARSPRSPAHISSECLASAGRFSRIGKKPTVARHSRLSVIGLDKSPAHPRYRQDKHKKNCVGTATPWSVMDIRCPRPLSYCLYNLEDPLIASSNGTNKDPPILRGRGGRWGNANKHREPPDCGQRVQQG